MSSRSAASILVSARPSCRPGASSPARPQAASSTHAINAAKAPAVSTLGLVIDGAPSTGGDPSVRPLLEHGQRKRPGVEHDGVEVADIEVPP